MSKRASSPAGLVKEFAVTVRSVRGARLDAEVVDVDDRRGGQPIYLVRLRRGAWSCTCDRPEPCKHVAAVGYVAPIPVYERSALVTA